MAHKLSRLDILALLFLYRKIWCRPNLYRIYGVSPMLSLSKTASALRMAMEDLHASLRHLETYSLLATIRPGQYFVRKYFTKEWDRHFSQDYDEFKDR